MGFKKNWKKRISKLLNKTKPGLKKVSYFVKENKDFVILTLTTVVGSSCFIPLTLPEMAKTIYMGMPVNFAGQEYRKGQALSLLKKLRYLDVFTVCEFEPLVRDLDLSDVTKVRKLYSHLLAIENIGNIDLKNHQVICIVTTLTSLYFSNCGNFNSIIESLLNALRNGCLSRRLFELICAMLRKRGVPVHEILAMLDSYE